VAWLKPHLKPFVKALNPLSLDDVVQFARLQEEAIKALKVNKNLVGAKSPLLPTAQSVTSYSNPNSRSFGTGSSQGTTYSGSFASSVAKPASQSFRPTRVITAGERAYKITKGLCYFCDQLYERGHKCPTKKSQLFLVEVPAEVDEDEGVDEHNDSTEVEGQPVGFELIESEPCISLQAINGVQGFQTMKATSHVGKDPFRFW